MSVNSTIFENRADLAKTLAHKVSQCLSAAITRQGRATLAVSGGVTPALFFDALSQADMTWEKVSITMVDERQVDEGSARSNARLVKLDLLKNNAARATFVPLFKNPHAANVADFDACILGMGSDGHTASFFPGGDTLAKAIDPANTDAIIKMSAPGAGEPRITFTLSKILRSRHIFLHIEGAEKQSVLQKALGGQDILDMPVRAVLQSNKTVEIVWCP
jgi:6-phosphogluconolactonase